MKKSIRQHLLFTGLCLLAALFVFGAYALKDQGSALAAQSVLDVSDLFTSRDLKQTASLKKATYITLTDGENVEITAAGVYVLSGTASDVTVTVQAGSEDKVQLVLDGVSITNECASCIDVVSADKVFVTTTVSENTLRVTGAFASDRKAVIYSEEDLVLNGKETLVIESTENGVQTKDDLKITGGSYVVRCNDAAFYAKDSICICDGFIRVLQAQDGLHAENKKDYTKGYVYISGGTIDITCSDDAIHAMSVILIDGGEITLQAHEGLEATYVQIRGGTLSITASDDGINAGRKSGAYEPTVDIQGGDITISVLLDESDAIDANGNILISGGTIRITATGAFDCDGQAVLTGGTVIVNGVEVTTLQIRKN